MQIQRVSILVLALLLTMAARASTIICVDSKLDTQSWVEKHLQEADIVVLGQVVAEETPDQRPSRPVPDQSAKSMKELLELIQESSKPGYETNHYQSVSLDVVKQWKGPSFRLITVKNHVVPGQLGAPLQSGKSYLVFAYKQEGNIYTISTVCRSTLDAESAEARVDVLDQITEAAKPVVGEPH